MYCEFASGDLARDLDLYMYVYMYMCTNICTVVNVEWREISVQFFGLIRICTRFFTNAS